MSKPAVVRWNCLSANVSSLRERVGISIAEAARQADLHKSVWWGIETGKVTNPRLFTLEAVARVLGTSLDDLLYKRHEQ